MNMHEGAMLFLMCHLVKKLRFAQRVRIGVWVLLVDVALACPTTSFQVQRQAQLNTYREPDTQTESVESLFSWRT